MIQHGTIGISCFVVQALMSGGLLAQSSVPAMAPVSVVEQREEVLDGSRSFVITLRNDVQKPVVGFIAVCELLDSEGRPFDRTLLGGVTLDPNEERHNPGETWKVQVAAASEQSPGTRVSAVRVKLDSVLFRDLSSAGPDVEKRGKLMRSEYEGSQMQLARLKRLLKNKGIDAVQEVLSREEPRFSRFSRE